MNDQNADVEGDSHRSDGEIEQSTREWVERTLERLDMVEWDRFVVGDDPNLAGRYIQVYGWIARETDDYKDFVIVEFFPETEDNLYGFTTSSDRYTEEIYRRMYDEEPDDHNDCQRVEHTFDVENAVELGEQTTLTDGGCSEGELSHPIRKGAVLRVTSDEENVEPVLYVADRLKDLDTGEIRYGLCDPTNTGFYDYHQEDVDDLFVDTGLTSDSVKPIMDAEVQELYEELCEHRWTAVHDPDTLEQSGFMCTGCRASRDELGETGVQ